MNSPVTSMAAALVLTLVLWISRSGIPLPAPPQTVDGEVTKVKPTIGGGAMLQVKSPRGSKTIMLSPQLGVIAPFSPGELVQVQGYERRWRGRRFLIPLSRPSVQRVTSSPIKLAEACQLEPGRLSVFQAQCEDAELFTSRAGKKHLRFILVDGDIRCQAILYEGTFGSGEQALISSGATLQFQARTSRYRSKPSMEVRKVEEAP